MHIHLTSAVVQPPSHPPAGVYIIIGQARFKSLLSNLALLHTSKMERASLNLLKVTHSRWVMSGFLFIVLDPSKAHGGKISFALCQLLECASIFVTATKFDRDTASVLNHSLDNSQLLYGVYQLSLKALGN